MRFYHNNFWQKYFSYSLLFHFSTKNSDVCRFLVDKFINLCDKMYITILKGEISMKVLHLSDIHLGLRIYEASLIEDQKYILDKIINIAEENKVESVIIAGDIYDKALPSSEAVELFDYFLNALCEKNINVFAISGNHDSAQRLSFGSGIMKKGGVYISGSFKGTVDKFTLKDEYGNINFFMMPFIKPHIVRPYFDEDTIESYNDAFKAVMDTISINEKERNIIISHQFVTGKGFSPERSESESIIVGGVDNIDMSNYEKFDYAALGHIHKYQTVGSENIVYCGTMLKYSFSEARQTKYAVLLDFKEKGIIEKDLIPLEPLRDMRVVEGYIDDIVKNAVNTDDYIYAKIKDQYIINSMDKMKAVYPNTLRIDTYVENQSEDYDYNGESFKNLSFNELFEKFYIRQNKVPLDDMGRKALEEIRQREEAENNETY